MEVFLVYLWLQLNGIKIVLAIVATIMLIAVLAWAMISSDSGDWEDAKCIPIFKKWVRCSIATGVLAFAIPSATTMAYMVATHYAVAFGQSPEAQKVVSLLRKKANEILDEELKAK